MSSRVDSRCAAFRHDRLRSLRHDLGQDIQRYLNKSPENQAAGDTLKARLSAFLTPQLQCMLLFRVSHFLWLNGWLRLAVLASRANFFLHRASIPPQSCIGPGCHMPHPAGVTFCGSAGRGLTLYSLAVCCPRSSSGGDGIDGGPWLGDRVSIGGHSAVLGPVQVGDDAKISFLVGLDRDAPARSIVLSGTTRVRARRCSETTGVSAADRTVAVI